MFYLISFYLFIYNVIMIFIFILMFNFKIIKIFEWSILSFMSMKINFIIYIDWMSVLFINVIFLISSMVVLYSIEYMKMDLNIKYFMYLILIFLSSMILMIISPNMISILVGWDGLGLSSYCLVIFYQNKKSNVSGMVTILSNRIGDICILLMISLMLYKNSWNFLFIINVNGFLLFLIILCSLTKSAQIPFSSWLPMAMSAPTPVSSLVHSSTLVTAGVYMLIRFSHLINMNFMFFLMLISSFTMFMAGMSANFEFDLKKIIALSTLSQLGLMIYSISLNLQMLAFFHLLTHAMFKSLLFLCSGIIIHNFFNHQDIRYMCFSNFNMMFIMMVFHISSFSLCGIPFLSGFYSKDLIIDMYNMSNYSFIFIGIFYMSMFLTVSYTTRLSFYLIVKINNSNCYVNFNLNNMMNYSILILFIMSIIYGSMLNWLMFMSLNKVFLTLKIKLLILLIMLLGILNGLIFFKNCYMMSFFLIKFYNSMFMFPLLLKKNKVNLLKLSNFLLIIQELGWLELLFFKKIINSLMLMMIIKNYMNIFYIILFITILLMLIVYL
uniref:NADH-ubiquinone oxidoreductase chain 5 n=1 Tax=Proterops sp. QL-2014 TaxID=1491724 RepID=A0A0U1WEQ1_9HYME|nr:NADH dehydrogenase subunit 5 [Proterops sp. QL-2014]